MDYTRCCSQFFLINIVMIATDPMTAKEAIKKPLLFLEIRKLVLKKNLLKLFHGYGSSVDSGIAHGGGSALRMSPIS